MERSGFPSRKWGRCQSVDHGAEQSMRRSPATPGLPGARLGAEENPGSRSGYGRDLGERSREAVSPVCVGGRNIKKAQGSRWGQKRGSEARAEPGRACGLFSGPELRPRPVHPDRDGLLPERPMSPRPRAAKRPSSARSSPGKGPGIAAAGKVQEERGARALG